MSKAMTDDEREAIRHANDKEKKHYKHILPAANRWTDALLAEVDRLRAEVERLKEDNQKLQRSWEQQVSDL